MQCGLIVLVVLVASPSVLARDANSIRRAIESRYQHAKTLKAIFFQRYSDGHGEISAESGTVYFSRPGRMRWEYESPEKKLFLVDGTNVWFYVPADHTASRAKLKESSDWRTPLALLAGKADLAELCRSVEVVDPASGASGADGTLAAPGNTLVRCIPRDAADASSQVLLETDPEARLVRLVIREAGNAETEFRFGNWQENIPIPEEKFHFQPPAGVAIVDQQSLSGAMR